ncbi:hypothetical protein ACIPJN_29275 [Streptomyces sp. NPDC086796]|uniref:hypothetical protein n=1 Tax=Streptomyces sp. NPDC086796 TaxID=3365760 RepID=UPI003801AB56
MDHAQTAADHAQAARGADELAQCLSLLLTYTRLEPALATALARIDTTDMTGPLDEAGLRAELAEAQAERDANAALAERYARSAAARVPGGPCSCCGHPAGRHARRLTEDARLPCGHDRCRCGDLVFA